MAQFPSKYRQTARVEQRREKFQCGDRVKHAHNPRHVGRVEAVWTHQTKVKWDCGIVEYLHCDEPLVLVERTPQQPHLFWARSRPATVAVSPKRKLEAYFAKLHERPAPEPAAAKPKDLSTIIRVVADHRRRA